MKATIDATPAAASTAPRAICQPPTTITSAVVSAMSTSTIGSTIAVSRLASTFAAMFAEFRSSNLRAFSSSRERLWITLTPETFSCRLWFTMEIESRTRMNATRACRCHTTRTATKNGITAKVARAMR